MRALVAPVTGTREDGEVRRAAGGCIGHGIQKKRDGDGEGSKADPVVGLFTCWSVQGPPTMSDGFCDGTVRWRRLQR